ncbi:hypothetical protein [Xanthomonas sp. 1678]|uniref:hypothetical protein n=1 Tax=Xanthomonas sp. 1678 TaxID=3158788 RepID=UPI002858CC23|nr:hypothetical protein [Xanthomonas translucens]
MATGKRMHAPWAHELAGVAFFEEIRVATPPADLGARVDRYAPWECCRCGDGCAVATAGANDWPGSTLAALRGTQPQLARTHPVEVTAFTWRMCFQKKGGDPAG